jgi:hypothetical protein
MSYCFSCSFVALYHDYKPQLIPIIARPRLYKYTAQEADTQPSYHSNTANLFPGWVDPTALLSVAMDGGESPLLIGEASQVQKGTGQYFSALSKRQPRLQTGTPTTSNTLIIHVAMNTRPGGRRPAHGRSSGKHTPGHGPESVGAALPGGGGGGWGLSPESLRVPRPGI